jgi:4-amino-4-deoxy-L-arabinose transferase-like glycosyltransferase
VGHQNLARSDDAYFAYYTHHPQGCVLLATLGASLGGTRSGLRLIFLPFAIGIVLLVYRLARQRGRPAAAVAASLAALTPLGVYYGAFVNFEVPTLFFTLLALHLFLNYRRRGRRKDAVRAALSLGVAVFCEWIALGLPFCRLVLLPFLRDGATRVRRVASW